MLSGHKQGSVEPDIAIYPKTEFDYSKDEVRVTTPPLCAIEILSPTQSLQELLDKAQEYFNHQVKSCWLVIPRLKNVYVFSDPQNYQIFRTDQTLHDPALGIDLELAQVFK
jgi:Uma2 family endonuclease